MEKYICLAWFFSSLCIPLLWNSTLSSGSKLQEKFKEILLLHLARCSIISIRLLRNNIVLKNGRFDIFAISDSIKVRFRFYNLFLVGV
jgi:hypothetical protein